MLFLGGKKKKKTKYNIYTFANIKEKNFFTKIVITCKQMIASFKNIPVLKLNFVQNLEGIVLMSYQLLYK